MKYLVFISFIIFCTSCKKDSNSARPASQPYLSTIKYYYDRSLIADSFLYDTDMRLISYAQHKWDSNGLSVVQARLEASFQYNLNEMIPQSYVFTGLSQVENHSLTFDSQNRIIKDTNLNGTHNVVYYSYSNTGISSTFLFGGNFSDRQVDSIFVSNGNILERRVYYSNGNPTAVLSGSLQCEYTSFSNPAYQPAITSTIGPLLHILTYDGYGGFHDFTSKDLFRKLIFRTDSDPAIERTCSWNRNNNGNVINGTISGALQSYVEFSYY